MEQPSEAVQLHRVASKVCRSKSNAYAAMWSMGQLSFHHGNRLRAALQAHLEHSISSVDVPRHHKRRAQSQSSSEQPRKYKKHAAGSTRGRSPSKQVDQQPLGAQLLQAAAAGKTTQVEQLVHQQGVDVNQQVAHLGRTALHAAAQAGHVSCCQALLKLGADTYVYDTLGVSALMLAAKNAHDDVIKVLLDAGADPFTVDQSGSNALLLAASCGSAESIKLLLEEGFVDADYDNSDLGAGEHALLLACEGGWVACVQLLLLAGAKVNRTDKEGRTALWVASRNGHTDVVRLLLAQPRIKHIRHFLTSTTPLEEAQAAGHRAAAALLSAHIATQQAELQLPPQQQEPSGPQQKQRQLQQQQQHQQSPACQQQQQQRTQHAQQHLLALPSLGNGTNKQAQPLQEQQQQRALQQPQRQPSPEQAAPAATESAAVDADSESDNDLVDRLLDALDALQPESTADAFAASMGLSGLSSAPVAVA